MTGAALWLFLLASPAPAQRLTRAALSTPAVRPVPVLTAPLAWNGAPALKLSLSVPGELKPALAPALVPMPLAQKAPTASPEETAGEADHESASAIAAKIFDGQGRAGFFFNDHDASAVYTEELKAFVARHDSVMVEGLVGGHDLAIFQQVSDGKLSPSQALRRLKSKSEPLNKAVLKTLHKTGKRVLPESIHLAPNKSISDEIDEKLMPRASALLEEAYDGFAEDNDPLASADAMRRFNAVMVKVHAKREETILSDLQQRLAAGQSVGVLLGMFHTWPYQQLRREGRKVSREFHPRAAGAALQFEPHAQSLRRLRFGKPPPSPAQDLREELGFLMLRFFLDPQFRSELAGEKSKIDNAIIRRMKQKDFEALAEELSTYADEHLDLDDKRLQGHVVRWLVSRGLIKPSERRFFRLR